MGATINEFAKEAAGHSVRILYDLSTGKLANKTQKADFIRGDVTDERSR